MAKKNNKNKWHPPEAWLSNCQAQELLDMVREIDHYREKQFDDKCYIQGLMKARGDNARDRFEKKLSELAPYFAEHRYRNNPNKRN